MKTETIEMLANVGSKTTAGGAVVGGIGAFIASNFVGLVGLFIALLGLLVNLHYKRKANKRHEADAAQKRTLRDLQMELMRAGVPFTRSDTDLGALEDE